MPTGRGEPDGLFIVELIINNNLPQTPVAR
jgi:hypothetical protein